MAIDEKLLAVAQGNIDALKGLYEQLRSPVYAIALAILRNQALAEDVMQDTFLRVWQSAAYHDPNKSARSWVLTIARNLALDTYRKRSRETILADVSQQAPPIEGECAVQKYSGERIDLINAVLTLPMLDRQIVILRALAGFTHQEIADELHIPAGTIRWRYRVAIKRIAQHIEGGSS